jgi:hypothetical protein
MSSTHRKWRLDRSAKLPWIWYQRLDRRNGYLAWGPVGTPFNRRRLLHWLVAIFDLWRMGDRRV